MGERRIWRFYFTEDTSGIDFGCEVVKSGIGCDEQFAENLGEFPPGGLRKIRLRQKQRRASREQSAE
jgi:hypothetical protein